MFRPFLQAATCAAALCVALIGCGDDDSASSQRPPSAAALMGDALRAADRQRSATISFSVDVRGGSPDPQVRQFLSKPITARLTGGVSERVVNLSGAVGALGRTERFGISADTERTFIGFRGTWYGPTDGLEQSGGDDAGELRRALAVVREHGDSFIAGRVTEGPDVDGPTWQVTGPLDAEGIIRAARAEGEQIDADDQRTLRVLAPLVRVTVAAGRGDRLPRRVAVRVDLTRAQTDRLRALADDDDELPIDELRAGLSLDMTNWGEPVRPAAVRDPQPLDALEAALGGALISAGG